MNTWYDWVLAGISFGLAAIGFAVLFNVPRRTLPPIFLMALVGGLTKVATLHLFAISPVLCAFFGAVLVGVLSIWVAHTHHAPPTVFAIPAVIPMVPGVLTYRAMIGLLKLGGDPTSDQYLSILATTLHNALTAGFMLMALAVGSMLPMLLTRQESAKNIRLRKERF